MKFLKFAQQLVTLPFKNDDCSLWLTVLSLMFFAYLLPVSWLHLIHWTVFPSLPQLVPPQNFDSCQVIAPYLCLFLTSQLSFKVILKPNLNFLKNWQQHSWKQSLSPFEILQHSKATGLIRYLYRSSHSSPLTLIPSTPRLYVIHLYIPLHHSKHTQCPTQYLEYLTCSLIAYWTS